MSVLLALLGIVLAVPITWAVSTHLAAVKWGKVLDDKSEVGHAVAASWRENSRKLEHQIVVLRAESAAKDQRIAEGRNEITRLKREVVFTTTEVLREEDLEMHPRDESLTPLDYQQRRAVMRLKHQVADLVEAKCTTEITHDVIRHRKEIRVEVRLGDLKEGL